MMLTEVSKLEHQKDNEKWTLLKIETIYWIECYIPFVSIRNKINSCLVCDTPYVIPLDSLVREWGDVEFTHIPGKV